MNIGQSEIQQSKTLCVHLFLSFVLLFLGTYSSSAQADACKAAKIEGKELATQQKETRWVLYGAGGSLVLGPLGTGVMTIVAAAKKPELPPDAVTFSMTSEERDCFVTGYKRKVRIRRTLRVLAGGVPINIALRTATQMLQEQE